jgi:hypothetical protein
MAGTLALGAVQGEGGEGQSKNQFRHYRAVAPGKRNASRGADESR